MALAKDARKAAENFAKHGIPFDYATRVFADPYHIKREDHAGLDDEARYQAIGVVEELLLFVAFTYRQDNIRIISARKATRRERRQYHEI